ncbi:MAG: DUF4328 domain-containing protein [Myxococcota bacterium]
MNEHESLLPPFVPTRRSVRALGVLFMISAAISWTAVGYDFSEIRLGLVGDEGTAVQAVTRLAYDTIGSWMWTAQLTILAITAASFLTWLHRVRVNVRALGARRLSYRREWTILGFLVPVLNFLRPYQVVKEIWQASDPSTGDPMAWKVVAAPRRIAVWWGLFVAYFVLEALAFTIVGSSVSPQVIRLGHGAGMLADLCAALSASVAYFVVVRITEAQEAKRRAFGRGQASEIPFDPRDAVA